MANPEHLKILKSGVDKWNEWRKENRDVRADLIGADLSKANFIGANLSEAILREANLNGANLNGANLSRANLSKANLSVAILSEAILFGAILSEAILSGANLSGANLIGADLSRADLSRADLSRADLSKVDLSKVDLSRADLIEANLIGANFSEANLSGANLSGASLIQTNVQGANLNDCRVYGISVWDIKSSTEKQRNLIITPYGKPAVTVDEIEVAQFIYLLLENEKIRNVIDTLTSKAVLILGRFSEERKKVLDSLKDMLRAKGYLPILFDFEKPSNQNLTETIKTLAGLSRFVIADITDAKSIPQELTSIVPFFPSTPVKPLILAEQKEYGMFESFKPYPWVLEVYKYPSQDILLANLEKEIIIPAEQKVIELKP